MTDCTACGRNNTHTHTTDQTCARCIRRTHAHLAYIADRWPLIPHNLAANRVAAHGTPIHLHRLDLGYPPIGGASNTTVHDNHRDQHGTLPAAGRLDAIVRDWAHTLDATIPVPTVPALCTWIARQLAWAVRHHPAIKEAMSEIGQLYIDVTRALDDDKRPTRYPISCGRCSEHTLRREVGADWIECDTRAGGCGALWGEDELSDLARQAMTDDHLIRPVDAAALLRVPVGTMRSWISRASLTPAGPKDRRYRWGDITALAEG